MSGVDLANWYRGLAARERRSVAAGALVSVVLLAWVGAIEPLDRRLEAAGARQARAAATIEYLDSIAPTVHAARARARSRARLPEGQTLLATIDASTRALGIDDAVRSVTPRADGGAALVVDEVEFDRLGVWLVRLQSSYGIRVRRVAVSAGRAPGLVRATVELTTGNSHERVHLEDR